LYNMLFGVNENTPLLAKVLDIDLSGYMKSDEMKAFCKGKHEIGRFRDIYVSGDEIVLYTRNGGGNREYMQETWDAIQAHPNYLRDEDDDFDCTYAYVYFSIPEQYKELVMALEEGEPVKVHEKFNGLLESMKNGTMTEEQKKVAEEIANKLKEALENGGGKVVEL
jgi:hypothetical protein